MIKADGVMLGGVYWQFAAGAGVLAVLVSPWFSGVPNKFPKVGMASRVETRPDGTWAVFSSDWVRLLVIWLALLDTRRPVKYKPPITATPPIQMTSTAIMPQVSHGKPPFLAGGGV